MYSTVWAASAEIKETRKSLSQEEGGGSLLVVSWSWATKKSMHGQTSGMDFTI